MLESYQSSSPISSPTRSPSPFPLFTWNHSPLQNLSQHAAAHDGAVGPRLTLGRSARRRATTRQAQSRAPATTTTCQPALPCPTLGVHRFLGSGTGFPTTGCTSCVCSVGRKWAEWSWAGCPDGWVGEYGQGGEGQTCIPKTHNRREAPTGGARVKGDPRHRLHSWEPQLPTVTHGLKGTY